MLPPILFKSPFIDKTCKRCKNRTFFQKIKIWIFTFLVKQLSVFIDFLRMSLMYFFYFFTLRSLWFILSMVIPPLAHNNKLLLIGQKVSWLKILGYLLYIQIYQGYIFYILKYIKDISFIYTNISGIYLLYTQIYQGYIFYIHKYIRDISLIYSNISEIYLLYTQIYQGYIFFIHKYIRDISFIYTNISEIYLLYTQIHQGYIF